MASSGHLDDLLNTTYGPTQFIGVSTVSANATYNVSAPATDTVSSVTVTTTLPASFLGVSLTSNFDYKVDGVDDATNTISMQELYGGTLAGEITLTVVGFTSSGILVSEEPISYLAPNYGTKNYFLNDTVMGYLSSAGVTQGQTLTFAASGSTGPLSGFTVQDATTGQSIAAAGLLYTGPVAGLTSELILPTTDQVTVTASSPNVFIQVGVQGQPNPTIAGIDVSKVNGNNVLDSYANSSFLTDGAGTDQNYLDARALTQNAWDTVVNFHSGDNVTIWGVTQSDFNLDWIGDTEGATGFTGLTGVFVPTAPNQHDAGVTLAGFKMADLTDGRLSITYDTINGTPYASIHAN